MCHADACTCRHTVLVDMRVVVQAVKTIHAALLCVLPSVSNSMIKSFATRLLLGCRSTPSKPHSEGGPTPACAGTCMSTSAQFCMSTCRCLRMQKPFQCGKTVDVLCCSGGDDPCKLNIKSFELRSPCNLAPTIPESLDICAGGRS